MAKQDKRAFRAPTAEIERDARNSLMCSNCQAPVKHMHKFCQTCGCRAFIDQTVEETDASTINGLRSQKQKPREISITQSILYIFSPKNRINVFLLPGLLTLAITLWGFRVNETSEQNYVAIFIVSFCLIFLPALFGYGSSIIRTVREHGYDRLAPDWTLEKLGSFWCQGLKIVLILSITALLALLPGSLCLLSGVASSEGWYNNIASQQKTILYMMLEQSPLNLMLAGLSSIALLLLLLPFALGAIVQSSESKRFLLSVPQLLQAGTRCYGKAFLLSLVTVAFLAIGLCVFPNQDTVPGWVEIEVLWCLAGPVWVAMIYIGFHLLAQAFDGYRENEL